MALPTLPNNRVKVKVCHPVGISQKKNSPPLERHQPKVPGDGKERQSRPVSVYEFDLDMYGISFGLLEWAEANIEPNHRHDLA